ncbi:MAG: MBL fold metallo-hydrolase [Treponema sp.]|nr:MBL fold metallo-hydrolase [Treponema sp.]
MKLTITGSGTSHGIPVIGCKCKVCTSKSPKDKRFRTSAIIQEKDTYVVIDTGPDFRLQALNYGLCKLDAVLLTHAHADHVHGLDDIRVFTREKSIPVFSNTNTLAEVHNRYNYVFRQTQNGGGKPHIELVDCTNYNENNPLKIGSIDFVPVPMKHGTMQTTGWRFGKFAYLTDLNFLPISSFDRIKDIEVLIIDGLRTRPHETHFSFEQALEVAEKTTANKIYLTHICHDYTHDEIVKILEEKKKTHSNLVERLVAPSYDGLSIELE